MAAGSGHGENDWYKLLEADGDVDYFQCDLANEPAEYVKRKYDDPSVEGQAVGE